MANATQAHERSNLDMGVQEEIKADFDPTSMITQDFSQMTI